MNKNILKTTSLSLLMLLASCGGNSQVNGTLYLGDGFTKKDAMLLNYNIDSVLKSGSKITGYISKQENTVLQSSYTLAYTSINPFSATNYAETGIMVWEKSMIEGVTASEIKYEITLDITKVFKDTEEESTVYFVFHTSNWDHSDLTTYTYTSFKYVWDNDKVNLVL